MRIAIGYGRDTLELDLPEDQIVAVRRQPITPPLADPVPAVREALEQPHAFPPLRRALTPDDHVVIVVDEQLPQLARLLTPILEHITKALITPESTTLLCAPHPNAQSWIDDLPDAFQDVHVEMHDPTDRRRLSYLATTRQGQRIYLNRSAVDADQLVVLTRRGYDPLLGYSGAEGAIYPALSDAATIQAAREHLSIASPDEPRAWPLRQQAEEVAWLLGAPFVVQVIDAADDGVTNIIGGSLQSCAEGRRLLDARWRVEIEEAVATVVVGVGGDPARHRFADLAQALACASRVVKPGGRIILLSQAEPALGADAEILRGADDAQTALTALRREGPADSAAGFRWASAARHATIYLLSRLPDETAEELFAVPLEHAGQVQRLLDGSCLFLNDAHKTLALMKGS